MFAWQASDNSASKSVAADDRRNCVDDGSDDNDPQSFSEIY